MKQACIMSQIHTPPPSRIPWPPLLILLTIVLGLLLDSVFPLFPMMSGMNEPAGLAIIALALASEAWCAATLWRARTTILPHRAVSHLVTAGPYRYSRNPIYVSHVAVTLGVGLLLHASWIVALTPLLATALQKLSIEPEERHLAEKFGADFARYAKSTRRWM